MRWNNERIKKINAHLFENSLHLINTNTGRVLNLYKLLRNPNRYISRKSYFPEDPLKSKRRILFDNVIHILKYGELNKYYFLFGLDRKEKNDLNQYVSHKTLVHFRNKRNLFPQNQQLHYNFICILRDKLIFGAFFKGLNIPTPENIATTDGKTFHLLLTKEILPFERITDFDIDAFCKVLTGEQGKGTFHLEIRNKNIYSNGELISLNQLKHRLVGEEWLIQKCIDNQHEQLRKLYPHSINTIRLMTANSGNSIEILGAVLRMGLNGNRVDNGSAGGITVGIDISTGELTRWGYFKPGFGTKEEKHPDTGILFKGFKLPYFQEAINQAIYAHRLLKGIYSIGWDIAITTKGPVFVEGNDNWEVGLYQLVNGGVKDSFKRIFKNIPVKSNRNNIT
ncbi:sugar-transfer associated ATP-grasp domain-containing protein [Rubrolithibacter danxiaensis]|uniref:sugar-transfer associated ATP-grasp domain-containing protein n=1 Tax=Rubrolithibacter danxiaensis TaxID=3390805 RepID=UPI003BF7C721